MPKGKNASETHQSRDTESRAASSIHPQEDAPWTQPSSLEAPPPLPGMVQRWIRVGTLGKDDPTNASRKFREGWVPRKSDTVDENFPLASIDNGKYAGCIGVDGMVLCQMTIERNNQRNAHFQALRDRMTQAINDQIAQSNQRLGGGFHQIEKVEERSVRVKAVAVQDD
jgi:hypothetical protein